MTDSVQVFEPGFRVTDNSTGAPVSGAKIKFYDAGTTTPKTVYSNSGLSSSLGSTVYTDSLGTPVASQGSSTAVMVYTGTAAYKVIITDANDLTIRTLDNIKGALDTSTFLTTGSTSTLTQPVITKTANYTIVAADRSKLIEANTTGGQFTLTLTAAATLGDNWSVKIRNSGTANQFILSASQSIAFEGQTFTSRAFQIGEGCEIICDGTGFKIVGHQPPLMASRGPAIITITDRVTSDPSATAGARYIVQTGYGSYSTGDIIEANGSSFNKYTPPTDCGWLAYVQDEDIHYAFRNSVWGLFGGGGLQVFTTSGTYTPTAGMTSCIVIATGGGGGGGGVDSDGSSTAAGAGGGAGGTAIGRYTASQVGASQTVTIGAAGTAGTNTGTSGGNGGDTTFGALATGGGGPGGTGVSATAAQTFVAGVAGGTASGGLLNIPGGHGNLGFSSGGGAAISSAMSGAGGASFWGGGARGVVVASSTSAGVDATAYGSGGSGGANIDTAAGVAGGAGMAGVVMVIEFF